MFDLRQFTIPFAGLKPGDYRYEFEVNEKFFEELGYIEEIIKGDFKINLLLLKHSNMLTLTFNIKGKTDVTCDRCLDFMELDVDTEQKLFVKFGDSSYEETDDVLVLSHGEQEIDVTQYIYEFIILAIPPVHVHPEGECDPEVIKKLEELKPKKNDTDPRWDSLKKLN
jgi:uncharacterized metal-binding protein YceD (DUF177 family)